MTAADERWLIDGAPVDRVSAADRGLAYGDGVFETLAVVDGRAAHWSRHLARLTEGCARLAIPAPAADVLAAEAAALCAGRARGVLRIQVTRGAGGRGYRPPASPAPTRILRLGPWPVRPQPSDGVTVRLCRQTLAEQPVLAGIKHANRLEQVLARAEWDDDAVAEGLMCDTHGRLIGGTMSNVFLVRAGELLTPDLSRCGVAGIMRAVVLERAGALGIPVRVTDLTPADAGAADALFLTSSLMGLWPVRRFQEREYSVTGGAPAAAVWRRLAEAVAPWGDGGP